MNIAELTPPEQAAPYNPHVEERTHHDELKPPAMPEHLKRILKQYRQSNVWKASWQIANTLIPLAAAWIAAWVLYDHSYWLSLAVTPLMSLLMVRVFVLHHDCTHGSFFKTRRANETWGTLLGTIVFTPFHRWRRSHNYHHAHSGDLDHRGEGYIGMYTVEEYQGLSSRQKFMYRLYRSPLFMFLIGPFIQFIILERFTFDLPKTAHVARWGVWKTNFLLAATVAAIGWYGGYEGLTRFVLILLPATFITSILGVWLFFVQHNYDDAYFKHHGDWNFATAALDGSSFYDLPQVLHWCSGNIGFHHIHHLDSLVPNYNLQACHFENPEFQTPYRISLWSSFRCIGLDLWDETQQRMVPFSAAQ